MSKYGLISNLDAQVIEKTLCFILNEFNLKVVFITEVGIYSGETTNGMREYLSSNGSEGYFTGIDNNKDGELIRFSYDRLLIGDSNEIYCKVEDSSQHLIFIDGCHCFAHVVSDFFCYAPKVKVGGYFAFHDTGEHIKAFKDFQHGDKNNPDAYISVRKALCSIGLLNWKRGFGHDYERETMLSNWKLIFDKADETNEAGGVTVFKKLY